jgi:hypothetical protein
MKILQHDSILNGKTTATPFLPHSVLPTDMREWIDPDELVGCVLEAAQTFYYWTPQLASTVNGESNGDRPVLLSVLTYCYATGTLATAEVARRMTSDPVVCILCQNSPVDPRKLILFRGQHSELVIRCFAHVACKAWMARIDQADISPMLKAQFATSLRQHAIKEARLRLRRAVELDFQTVPPQAHSATPRPKAAVSDLQPERNPQP